MPVNIMNQSSRVRLRFVDSVDGEGRERLVSKTYSNLKPDAMDEDVYAVAADLSVLQTKPLKTVVRTDEKELME